MVQLDIGPDYLDIVVHPIKMLQGTSKNSVK